MKPVELVFVNSKKVKCDGGKDSSRHPLVYLDLNKDGYVICSYCSKYFTTKEAYNNKIALIKETPQKIEQSS